MPSKIVSYKLNSDGTTSDFIQDGGYFPSASTWEEMTLLGITVAGATIVLPGLLLIDGVTVPVGVSVYNSKEEIIAYLNTYTSGLREIDPVTREDKGLWSQSDAADFLWEKLSA